MIIDKVSGSEWPEYLQAQAVVHNANPKADTANYQSVVLKAKQARASLMAFSSETHGWKVPFEFTPMRTQLESLLREWDDAIWECEDVKASFNRLRKEGKNDNAAARKTFQENKTKIAVWFDRVGITLPKEITKAMAEAIYHHHQNADDVGVKSNFVCRNIEIDEEVNREFTFGQPWVERSMTIAAWKDAVDNKEGSSFAKALWAFMAQNAEALRDKATRMSLKLLATDALRIGVVPVQGDAYAWNGRGGAIDTMKPVDSFPSIVIVQRALLGNWNIPTQPFRGLCYLMTCVLGRACILVLPPALAAEIGPDLYRYLDSLESQEKLLGCFAAYVEDGDSVFVPWGFVPLWWGVPDEPQLKVANPKLSARGRKAHRGQRVIEASQERVAFSFHLLLEESQAHNASAEAKALIMANLILARTAIPTALRQHQKWNEWCKLFEPTDAPVQAAA